MSAAALRLRLLGSATLAAGCRLPARTWVRMADPPHHVKRQRLATATAAAAEPAPQQMAPGPALQQQQPPPDGDPAKQPAKRKAVVMPTPVVPPTVPADAAAWENAVLLVDKPKGWTSFDVCGKLRPALAGLLGKKNRDMKVGHAGTLDPMATGLLIVCVGRGTKAVDAFMAMTKKYSGTLRLGEATPSLDAETPVEAQLPWEHITDEQMLAARERFVGEIEQIPPMYSAIRVGGKRLYESARKGQEVERAARRVTVERFELRRDASDRQAVHFEVTCSKGTYIRSLAADLGAALGSAAHLTALRREAIGEHSVGAAWEVTSLADQLHAQRRAAQAAAEEQAAAAGEQAAAAADGAAP